MTKAYYPPKLNILFDWRLNIVFNSSHALTDLPGDLEMGNQQQHTAKSRTRDEVDYFVRGM